MAGAGAVLWVAANAAMGNGNGSLVAAIVAKKASVGDTEHDVTVEAIHKASDRQMKKGMEKGTGPNRRCPQGLASFGKRSGFGGGVEYLRPRRVLKNGRG